jgi:hypothetical protein
VGAPQEFSALLATFDVGSYDEAIPVSRVQSNQEPVIAVPRMSLIQQQPQRTIVVCDHDDVDGAVVVDVAASRSAAYLGDRKGGTGDSGHVSKLL